MKFEILTSMVENMEEWSDLSDESCAKYDVPSVSFTQETWF